MTGTESLRSGRVDMRHFSLRSRLNRARFNPKPIPWANGALIMSSHDHRLLASPAPAGALQGAVNLTHLGVIAAAGGDAATFLHSQPQDSPSWPQRSASGGPPAKGRLLASFVAWKEAHDRIRLACSAEVLPAVLKRL
jgi:hypothetical protein